MENPPPPRPRPRPPLQTPDCTKGIGALSSVSDTCVFNVAEAVLAAWKAYPNDGKKD